GDPAQQMGADAEMALLHPDAAEVQRRLVILRFGKAMDKIGMEFRHRREWPVEIAGDHRVEHVGIAAQVAGKFGRRGADVDEEVEKRRMRLEEREELDPGRKTGKEGVECNESLVGVGGSCKPGEDLRLDPAEDAARALGAEGREPRPPRHAVASRLGIGKYLLDLRDIGSGGFGNEERLGQGGNPLETVAEFGLQGAGFGVRQGSKTREFRFRLRQAMGLRVVKHLNAMLEHAVGNIGSSEFGGGVPADPALVGQGIECRKRCRLAEIGIAAADDELTGLGKELDLANAAPAQLEVMAGNRERPPQPLVVADPQPHVLSVLDRAVVKVAAPEEGSEALEEGLPRLDRAGAGPRLDEGRALPGATEAFVIVFRRIGGDADRRYRRIGAEPQVGAEDIALGGLLLEELHEALRDADEAAAERAVIGRLVPALVEEDDEVDVGGVVQPAGAQLDRKSVV